MYDSDGSLEVLKLKTLSRTYAQAVAGRPLQMGFERKNSTFTLLYRAPLSEELRRAPTEIYLNEALHYPRGYSLTVTPEGCTRHEAARNRLFIYLREPVALGEPPPFCGMIFVKVQPREGAGTRPRDGDT